MATIGKFFKVIPLLIYFTTSKLSDTCIADIVVINLQMQVSDSLEVVKYIRSGINLKNLPIVAITTKLMDQDERKLVEAEFSRIIKNRST